MKRLVRFALLSLLALVLPVQGWAAATQWTCAPMHPGMHAPAGHAMHDMAKAGAQNHAPDGASPRKHDAACSICAACTVGMTTLPSSAIRLSLPDGVTPTAMAPVAPFRGHIPDGIKRPPRTVLV